MTRWIFASRDRDAERAFGDLRNELESSDVAWSYDCEVAAIQRRDRGEVEAFRDGDNRRVHQTEAKIGVLLNQLSAPRPAFGVEVETAEFAVSNRRHERCFGDRAEARLDHPGAFDRDWRRDHKVVLVVEESRTNEMFWSGTVCGCEYDIRIDQQHDALDAFDHLLCAHRLAAGDAVVDRRFVQHTKLLRLPRQQQSRVQRDRVFRARVRADPALDAFRLDEAQLRQLGIVGERTFRTGADAGHAQRARIGIDLQRSERRARAERDRRLRDRRVLQQMLDSHRDGRSLVGSPVERRGNAYGERALDRPRRFGGIANAAVDENEVSALISERLRDGVAESHLRGDGGPILRRLASYRHGGWRLGLYQEGDQA